MIDNVERNKVARAMIQWGWGDEFIRNLGETLICADSVNAQRIQDAFPEYWETYLKKSEKQKE